MRVVRFFVRSRAWESSLSVSDQSLFLTSLCVGGWTLLVSITDLILRTDNDVSPFVINITSVDGRAVVVVIGVTNTGVAGDERATAGIVRRHTDNS